MCTESKKPLSADPRRLAGGSLARVLTLVFVWIFLLGNPLAADETAIPLTNPDQPVIVDLSILVGDIKVEAYDGDHVLLLTDVDEDFDDDDDEERDGLRRLPRSSFGLTAEEEDNVVVIQMNGQSEDGVRLRVPRRTSLHLSTVQDGDIEINGVEGEHDLQNTNGDVTAHSVSGTVQASSVNGEVTIEIVNAGQGAMAFSSLNGDVDLTLPADFGARLELQSVNGEIFTDFDIVLDRSAPKTEQERVGNRYRVEIEQSVSGTINGGGLPVILRSHNGDLLIRKGD